MPRKIEDGNSTLTEPETPTEEIATIDQETIRPIKIGVPRGLFFFKFFPLWKAFLEYLHCEVVVCPQQRQRLLKKERKPHYLNYAFP